MNITMTTASTKRSCAALISAALTGSLFSFDALAELQPSLVPGGNFALENWSLTLPVDADGNTSGRPQTVPPAQLSGTFGFSDSSYFYTDTDGAMTFWAPINGALSNRSDHPRAELRQMIDPSSNAVNWDNQGTAYLDARLRVMQAPSSNGIVTVGQIHAYNTAALVVVYYQYNPDSRTGRVIAKMQEQPDQPKSLKHYLLADNIKLGQAFTYRLRMERTADGVAVASASVNGGAAARLALDPIWDNERYYFKAGAYLHTSGTSDTDGARVKFYRLATSHPADGLAINSLSALPEASVQQSYSANLSYKGGVGGATWRLVSGFPPAGLTLSGDGVISGEPEAHTASPIPNDFTVQVRDANGNTASKKFSILVNP